MAYTVFLNNSEGEFPTKKQAITFNQRQIFGNAWFNV